MTNEYSDNLLVEWDSVVVWAQTFAELFLLVQF